MSSISESEINALRAHFHAVAAPLAPSVPPMIHTVNAAVPLQPIQQVPPVAGPVHLNPQAVLPDEDSRQPVLQDQQLVLVADQESTPASATTAQVTVPAETQQLATGEELRATIFGSTAAEEHSSSSDDPHHQEDDDPDADDNEQLRFDAEVNGIAGLDSQQGDDADEHRQKWLRYVSHKDALMGVSVTKGQGANAVTWTVRHDVTEANVPVGINSEFGTIGVKRFDFRNKTTISYSGANECMNLLLLLIHLWPGDWRVQIKRINSAIDLKNDENAAKI